ncbi:MAG: hypothetical protein H6927_15695 [Burkholderiaceae bacterium]|nr:hypothetical protein [Burkholderiaceae bacterium]
MTNLEEQRRALQRQMEWLLEDVPIKNVLQELRIRPVSDGSALQGFIALKGRRLQVNAEVGWDGRWRVLGTGFNQGGDSFLCDERMLPARQERGRTVLAVLEMWQALHGVDASTPEALQSGQQYAHAKRALNGFALQMPALAVDGVALRHALKWIRRRFQADLVQAAGEDRQVNLDFQAGLLRLDVGGQVYGCAARGVWAVPAAVRLDDLLAAPPWSLRGGWIRLNWATDGLHINGWLAGAIKEGRAHG